jgi:4-hydroxybenzoate decarboxylase subunit C
LPKKDQHFFFKNVKGSPYPVVTNLFGTQKRAALAFGTKGFKFIEKAAKIPEELLPPTLSKLWQFRQVQRMLFLLALKNLSVHM